MPRSALVVGSVERASEGAAKECEALLDALESLSVLLADALLVDEGAAVDEAEVEQIDFYEHAEGNVNYKAAKMRIKFQKEY